MTNKDLLEEAVKNSFHEIKSLKPILGQATDALNETLKQFESRLESYKTGVSTSVQISSDGEIFERLCFSKQGNRWVLVLETHYPNQRDDDDGVSFEPLLNASREDRLTAVKFLPALVLSMAETMRAEIERVESADKETRALIEALDAEFK
jgi:hypothetical protein